MEEDDDDDDDDEEEKEERRRIYLLCYYLSNASLIERLLSSLAPNLVLGIKSVQKRSV